MNPDQMRALLRKEPFEPFRLHLTDGRSFDIVYPRMNLVTDLRLVIGIPDPNDPEHFFAKGFARVPWTLIQSWEPLLVDSAH